MKTALIGIAIGCLWPVTSAAQAGSAIEAGARARVWTSELRGVKGVIETSPPGTRVLRPEGQTVLGLQHEEVGGGSSVGQAAELGAWSAALFGGRIGVAVGEARPPENWERVL